MNQQVSKGEFDRRVKLLEQQVKTSTNDLINRLQAESEAFIEKLRNTQLDIDALRQEVEEIEGDDTKLNSLIDSYNNFAANTLRFNDVFDADGQFTGKIRPLSVETAALSVGTRSQQLDIEGIEFRVLPYLQSGSNYGYLEIVSSKHSKYKFNSDGTSLEYIYGNTTDTVSLGNAGTMFHYGYGTDTNPKLYSIDEQRILITSTDSYYIYARLQYNIKEYEIKAINSIDDFNKYFYELYIDDSGIKKRIAEIGYNSETIYYTKTAGNFTSLGIISKDTFANNIDNLYTSNNDSSKVVKPEYNDSTIYYVKYEDVDIDTDSNKANIIISTEQYTFKNDSSTIPPYYDNNKHYIVIKIGSISQEQTSAKYDDTSSSYYKQRKVDMTYGQTTIDGRLITTGRIEGNGAWFDLDNGVIGGNIQFNSAWNSNISSYLTSNNYTTTNYVDGKTGIKYVTETIYYSTSTDVKSTPGLPQSRVISNSESSGEWCLKLPTSGYFYYTCTQSYGIKNSTIYDLTFGNIVFDQALTTSANALKGTTTIAGGLLLSQKIITGSGNNCAVLNGTDSYSFWAGNSSASYAPVWIKRDGSAKFGDLNVASNGILSFTGSDLKIKKMDYDFGNPLTAFYNDVSVNYTIPMSGTGETTSNRIEGSLDLRSHIGSAYTDAIVWVSVSVDCGFRKAISYNPPYWNDVKATMYIRGNSSEDDDNNSACFYTVVENPSYGSSNSEFLYNVSASGHFRLSWSSLTSSNSTVVAKIILSPILNNGNIQNYFYRNASIKVTRIQKLNCNYAENGLSIYNNGIVIYKHIGPNSSLILQGIKADGIPVSGIRRIYNYERDMTIFNS